MIRITLPDGSVREYEKGTTAIGTALSTPSVISIVSAA